MERFELQYRSGEPDTLEGVRPVRRRVSETDHSNNGTASATLAYITIR